MTWTLRSLVDEKMRHLKRTRGSNEEVFKSGSGVIVTRRMPRKAGQMKESRADSSVERQRTKVRSERLTPREKLLQSSSSASPCSTLDGMV